MNWGSKGPSSGLKCLELEEQIYAVTFIETLTFY